MKTFLYYFWRIVFIIFIVVLIGSGITGIIMPRRFIQSSEGRISISEYQSFPLQAKLIAFGWSLFQIILGSWFLYKSPLKKDKIISIILIIFFVLFYCLIVAPAVK